MSGAAPVNPNFDRDLVRKHNHELFNRPTRRHPLAAFLGAPEETPEPYAYRVSDLQHILPEDLRRKALDWPLAYPVEVSRTYKPSQQRLAARIRLDICKEARDRGVTDPRLIQAIIMEGEAVIEFQNLARHYQRKGLIE